jgi:hypothetical protein
MNGSNTWGAQSNRAIGSGTDGAPGGSNFNDVAMTLRPNDPQLQRSKRGHWLRR